MDYKKYLKEKHPNAKWYDDGFKVEDAKHNGAVGEVVPSIVKKPWGFV